MSKASLTIRNRIYRDLRRAIITGRRKSGERFNVPEVAAEYNTSITPVRDALQMLSQEGLVNIKPRSGYFVTSLTLKELRDMLDMRRILEEAAIERAAQRITPEQIQELKHVHAGYSGDDEIAYDRYTEENRRFHTLLAKASGNQELTEAIGRLLDRLARFMVLRHAGAWQESSHARIIDALEARNYTAAKQALIEEIDSTREAILDYVMEASGGEWSLQESLSHSN